MVYYHDDVPIIKLIEYKNEFYVYDTFQNELLKIEKTHYIELQRLQKLGCHSYIKNARTDCAKDIVSLMEKGYFKDSTVSCIKHPENIYFDDLIMNNVGYLQFQVTKQCNMECRYCSFASELDYCRSHNNTSMSLDVAKKAIEYLRAHSSCVPEIRISFYGGEPLLNFNLIVKITEIVNHLFRIKRVRYYMTTNLTLLSDRILDFLVKNSVSLLVSLDGGKEIHNSHRKFRASGKGTYDTVLNNLNKIRSSYPEYFDRCVRFNSVVFPDESYDDIIRFFEQVGIDRGKVSVVNADLSGIDYNIGNLESVEKIDNQNSYFKRDDSGVLSIISDKKMIPAQWHPNGTCIPGVGRLFVDVDGNFYPCEKVIESNIISIGNVSNGLNLEKIRAFANIGKISESNCKKCWAIRFCSSCIIHCTDIEKNCISPELKARHCADERHRIENEIKKMIQSGM